MRDRLKLGQQFDPELLQHDLRNVDTPEWVDHFVPEHFEGSWSVLPLRAPANARHPIQMIYPDPSCEEYVDTPLLAQCPNVRQVLAALPCPLRAVRLMKLAAGSVIKPHKDHDLDAELGHVRLHIPVVTNPDVDFRLNGTRVVMREGECWYLRLSETHEVANRGGADRVHLVIDAHMNPWLAEQLALAEVEATQPHAIGDEPSPEDPALIGADAAPGEGWIPFKVHAALAEPVVEWCYLGNATLSDPFFEQTVARFTRRSSQPAPRSTSIDALLDWETTQPGVPPTAFVFHVSRCGSTLFSRLAAALPDTLAVSEAGIIDHVLRAKVPEARRIRWLRAVISALGQPRRGGERRLLIKFDAWHVLHLALVRAAFPGVPCVFLYREPAQVVASQLRLAGSFLLWDAPEAAMPSSRAGQGFEREDHFARVLGAQYASALPLASAGQLTLMNYANLPDAACEYLLNRWALDDSDEIRDAWRPVILSDAKEPSVPFNPSARTPPSPRAVAAAAEYVEAPYRELELLRRRHVNS